MTVRVRLKARVIVRVMRGKKEKVRSEGEGEDMWRVKARVRLSGNTLAFARSSV